MGGSGCARCDERGSRGSVGLSASIGVGLLLLLFLYFNVVQDNGLHAANRASETETRRSQADGGAGGGAQGVRPGQSCGSALARFHRSKAGMMLTQLAQRARSLGTTCKILLGLFQVLSSFRDLRSVRWPRHFENYLAFLAPLSFDFLSVLPVDCFVSKPLSLAQRSGLVLALPIFGAVCIVLMAALASLRKLPSHERGLRAVAMRPDTISVQVWMMLVLFPVVTKVSLLPFDCVTVGDKRLMRFNPEESCDTNSWYGLAVLGGVGTAVYAVGIPVLICLLTHVANRARLQAEKDGGLGEGDPKTSQRIGRARLLTHSYDDKYYCMPSLELELPTADQLGELPLTRSRPTCYRLGGRRDVPQVPAHGARACG